MRRIICGVVVVAAMILAACTTFTPVPTAVPSGQPTFTSPTGYRPVQTGDMIEGVNIGYQYILPSLQQPTVVLAFSPYLLHFANVKPELSDGLVAFIRDLPSDKRIYAFDENNPQQTAPQLLSWDGNKPVEVIFIPVPEDKRTWSVTEEDENGIQAAYKIVRRKDGGLRFIDAYGKAAIFSAGELYTINGTGMGLMFSARLALLRMILNEPKYQVGKNIMQNNLPDNSQYDPRILKLDPTQEGISINRDWVLVTIPGPSGGMASP